MKVRRVAGVKGQSPESLVNRGLFSKSHRSLLTSLRGPRLGHTSSVRGLQSHHEDSFEYC